MYVGSVAKPNCTVGEPEGEDCRVYQGSVDTVTGKEGPYLWSKGGCGGKAGYLVCRDGKWEDPFGEFGDYKECLGANTLLSIPGGAASLRELKAGDTVLSWDVKKQAVVPQKLLSILRPSKVLGPHLEIKTSSGYAFTITPDHLVYLPSGKRVNAESLSVGDSLKTCTGKTKIISIMGPVMDEPAAPVLLNGTVVLANGTIVSIYAGSEDEVNKMESILLMSQPFLLLMTPEQTDAFISGAYKEFCSAFQKDGVAAGLATCASLAASKLGSYLASGLPTITSTA